MGSYGIGVERAAGGDRSRRTTTKRHRLAARRSRRTTCTSWRCRRDKAEVQAGGGASLRQADSVGHRRAFRRPRRDAGREVQRCRPAGNAAARHSEPAQPRQTQSVEVKGRTDGESRLAALGQAADEIAAAQGIGRRGRFETRLPAASCLLRLAACYIAVEYSALVLEWGGPTFFWPCVRASGRSDGLGGLGRREK